MCCCSSIRDEALRNSALSSQLFRRVHRPFIAGRSRQIQPPRALFLMTAMPNTTSIQISCRMHCSSILPALPASAPGGLLSPPIIAKSLYWYISNAQLLHLVATPTLLLTRHHILAVLAAVLDLNGLVPLVGIEGSVVCFSVRKPGSHRHS